MQTCKSVSYARGLHRYLACYTDPNSEQKPPLKYLTHKNTSCVIIKLCFLPNFTQKKKKKT